LKSELKHHDFYLQLSHSESLGMSVIEAQTLGLPAIVSDSDGLPEVIQHNQTGYNVKPYDVEEASEYIEMLWKNPKLYREFSQAAIINSQTKYSISKDIVDTNFIEDKSEGKFHIERTQDLTPVIEENK